MGQKSGLVAFVNYRSANESWMQKTGLYNLPFFNLDVDSIESCKKISTFVLSYSGNDDEIVIHKVMSAKFWKIVTRTELLRTGYPDSGKPHATKYLLFKVASLNLEEPNEYLCGQIKHGANCVVFFRMVAQRAVGQNKVMSAMLEAKSQVAITNELCARLGEPTTKSTEVAVVSPKTNQLSFFPLWSSQKKSVSTIVDKTQVFRMGELFCGPGGIAHGARCARVTAKDGTEFSISHAWATDYDPATCDTYAHNICDDDHQSVICHDIRTLNLRTLKAISEIDGLSFGFPCNDFSVVGEQKGVDGTFGPLYQYGIRVLRLCKPKWFLAENVGGLQSANDGMAFGKILTAMYEAGYSVFPHLYSFEKYGVPQARQRVIIVGIRKDLGLQFKIPSPEPYAGMDVSCRNAIENPPISANALNNEITKQSAIVAERLKYIKPGENAFTAKWKVAG